MLSCFAFLPHSFLSCFLDRRSWWVFTNLLCEMHPLTRFCVCVYNIDLTHCHFSACVCVIEREGKEGAPGGSERKAEGADCPAEGAVGWFGAFRLPGRQLWLTPPVCRHGEAEGTRHPIISHKSGSLNSLSLIRISVQIIRQVIIRTSRWAETYERVYLSFICTMKIIVLVNGFYDRSCLCILIQYFILQNLDKFLVSDLCAGIRVPWGRGVTPPFLRSLRACCFMLVVFLSSSSV